MEIIAITQARIGSTRFPSKILKEINRQSLLDIHLKRISKSKLINKIIVASTFEDGVEVIKSIADQNNAFFFQGDLYDVLDRMYQAALLFKPQIVVRLTSDCPLIDSDIIDACIDLLINNKMDYVSNTLHPSFPDGMDVEVMRFEALEQAWSNANLKSEREHVTPYVWKNSDIKGGSLFKAANYTSAIDWSKIRLTVDDINDFELIKHLVDHQGVSKSCAEYVDYILSNPKILEINQVSNRNEGYDKSLSEDSIINLKKGE